MIFLLNLLKDYLMILNKKLDFLFIFLFCLVYQTISTYLSISDDNILHWLEAIRLNNGQTIYKDFFVPWGPISGFIPFFFLKLFGSLGIAIIVLSFLYSFIFGILIYLIIYSLTEKRNIALSASIITVCWFGIFIGGWYVDHVSYLFTIFAAYIFILNSNKFYKFFLIGIILALSLLTKQTTGFISSFILFLLILLYPMDKKLSKLLYVIFGGTSVFIIFILFILYFTDTKEFINYFYKYPIEYAKNEPNKNPIVILKNLFLPFNINILNAINNGNNGLLIFYPIVIYIYFTYYLYFKFKIYKITNKFNFYFNFFLISSLACGPMIGRNYTDVFWTFGAVFLLSYFYLIKMNNKLFIVFKYFPIYLITLSLITFCYPKMRDINYFYFDKFNYLHPLPITNKSLPFVDFNDFVETDKFIKNLKKNEKTKFYIIDDNALFFILTNNLNNISKNLYFDLNVNIPRNKNSFYEWVINQIIFIENENPKFVIKSFKNSQRLFRIQNNNFNSYNIDVNDLKYFDAFIKENYNLIFQNNTFEVLEIKR